MVETEIWKLPTRAQPVCLLSIALVQGQGQQMEEAEQQKSSQEKAGRVWSEMNAWHNTQQARDEAPVPRLPDTATMVLSVTQQQELTPNSQQRMLS